jgi:hypothetical protein
MFQDIRVGDEVGVSTGSEDLPYAIQKVVDVYPRHISVNLSCDANALYYKSTGLYVSPTKTTRHAVPLAAAVLENALAQEDELQQFASVLGYEFEKQIDAVKAKFYKGESPDVSRLQSLIKQLKDIK